MEERTYTRNLHKYILHIMTMNWQKGRRSHLRGEVSDNDDASFETTCPRASSAVELPGTPPHSAPLQFALLLCQYSVPATQSQPPAKCRRHARDATCRLVSSLFGSQSVWRGDCRCFPYSNTLTVKTPLASFLRAAR